MAANPRQPWLVIVFMFGLATPCFARAQDAGTPDAGPTPVITPAPLPVPKSTPKPPRRSPPLRPKAKPRDEAVIEQLQLLMLLDLLKDLPVIEDDP